MLFNAALLVVDALTELLRHGVRRLIVDAVEAELLLLLKEFSEEKVNGDPRLARNGYLPQREILTGIGKISVRLPRLRDRGSAEEKVNVHSGLISPDMTRSTTIDEVLPLLYLKGISEANFSEVLEPIFGKQTKN